MYNFGSRDEKPEIPFYTILISSFSFSPSIITNEYKINKSPMGSKV
jgi:hypothetical protein